MKSSFIKVFLSAKNEFRTNMDLVFNGTEYKKVDVKIDTGCGYSSFPVCKLGISPSDAYAMNWLILMIARSRNQSPLA